MFSRRFLSQTKAAESANAAWIPTKQEMQALDLHGYVESLGRVDQIWHWLQENHGEVLAVDAPHASHPEKFNYQELSERISIAASAFRKFGIQKGDVVALFSENSPRWLVADQGIMRLDAFGRKH